MGSTEPSVSSMSEREIVDTRARGRRGQGAGKKNVLRPRFALSARPCRCLIATDPLPLTSSSPPTPAQAAYGQGTKFSIFGLLGNGDSYSEGAAYGSDQGLPVYSAYSPFQPVNDGSLANSKEGEFIKFQKGA